MASSAVNGSALCVVASSSSRVGPFPSRRLARPLPNEFMGSNARNEKLVLKLSLHSQHMKTLARRQGSPQTSRGVTCLAATGSMQVAVAGATGFVGTRLVEMLVADGHSVTVLARSAPGSAAKARSLFSGSKFKNVSVVEAADWSKAVAGATGVVNLAGTPISTRWDDAVKAEIKASRVVTTEKLVAAIAAAPSERRPKVLVNGSALGYYGISATASFTESSPAGQDFLAKVCLDWEAAASKVEGSGTRLVILRTGIVLGRGGGVIAKMLPIFQLFAGGPMGSGEQWFSWVHRDDLCALIIEALRNPEYSGVINGTAPHPVRMAEMCGRLGETLKRPSWLPVPAFALQAVLGEGSILVLEGQRVLPEAAQRLGFRFKYPTIDTALSAIVS